MANPFKKSGISALVEDTLDIKPDGSVTFRAGTGKGSGRPIEIPASEFSKFVSFMNKIQNEIEKNREISVVQESNEELVESE